MQGHLHKKNAGGKIHPIGFQRYNFDVIPFINLFRDSELFKGAWSNFEWKGLSYPKGHLKNEPSQTHSLKTNRLLLLSMITTLYQGFSNVPSLFKSSVGLEGLWQHLHNILTFKVCLYYGTLLQHEKAATFFWHTESFFRPTLIRVWKRRIVT